MHGTARGGVERASEGRPKLAYPEFDRRLRAGLGVSTTSSTGSRVLVEARRLAFGSASDSYAKLLPYLFALQTSAPDSVIVSIFPLLSLDCGCSD